MKSNFIKKKRATKSILIVVDEKNYLAAKKIKLNMSAFLNNALAELFKKETK